MSLERTPPLLVHGQDQDFLGVPGSMDMLAGITIKYGVEVVSLSPTLVVCYGCCRCSHLLCAFCVFLGNGRNSLEWKITSKFVLLRKFCLDSSVDVCTMYNTREQHLYARQDPHTFSRVCGCIEHKCWYMTCVL